MPHISISQPEEHTSSGPIVLPDSFIALKAADASSRPLLQELQRFIGGGEYKALSQLRGSAAAEAADFLDELIRSKLNDHPEFRRRMIRVLRYLCRPWGVLPASYTLQGEVIVSDGMPWAGGGFSEVWRGTLGCEKVAIKVIKKTIANDPEKLMKQLSKEAVIWKHLKHRNLLPLYGVSTGIRIVPGLPCLVSPLMENGNIRKFVRNNPTFNRFDLLVDVCEGLDYLHSEGFVHGDLKGDNVLIDSENRACLVDFGFSRVSTPAGFERGSSSSDAGGTEAYMAPELFKRLVNTVRSTVSQLKEPVDVYAFGTLIHEVLSGKPPPRGWGRLGRPSWAPIPNHPAWDLIERCRAEEPTKRPGLSEVRQCLIGPLIDLPERWPSPPTSVSSTSTLSSSPPLLPRLREARTVQVVSRRDDPGFQWRVSGGGIQKPGLRLGKSKTM